MLTKQMRMNLTLFALPMFLTRFGFDTAAEEKALGRATKWVDNHPRANMLNDPSHYVLQCLAYLDKVDIYKDCIKMFHVRDAKFNPTGRQVVYFGYQS